jgi:arylsulfatase A
MALCAACLADVRAGQPVNEKFHVSAAPVEGEAAAPERPNIVLIMTDDQGYRDVGCFGHPAIKTPVLDRMAAGGVRLTDFYAAASVCTPTRMGLMTGCYPRRVGWPGYVLGYRISHDKGLHPDEITLAEVFRSAGYATGCVGKWHLGKHPPLLPTNQGFDSFYGIPYSNNMSPKVVIRGTEVVEDPFDNRLLTEQFTDEALAFIEQHKDRPFFLYLPYSAPHFPVQPHPDWKGRSAFGPYGDVIEELDWSIGRILKLLKEKDLDEQTLVIFMTDNGPERKEQASALPLRGFKWDAYEGSHRVPCIMRWPGHLLPGTVSHEVVSMIDLLPTLAHVAHIDLDEVMPEGRKLDGLELWDAIHARPAARTRDYLLFWHGQGRPMAIRSRQWKLFPAQQELYDLSTDISETTNVAGDHPEIVQRLAAKYDELLQEIEANIRPMADIQQAGRGSKAGS